MSVVLTIEQLWKEYRLGVIGHGTLYRDLQSWWARLRRQEDPNTPINLQLNQDARRGGRVWALRDVSLNVSQGEVIGIIGKNGAGKSTLLKIISRVTTPTRGLVKIKGRMTSLLEVGTGFHPELTGRENIFLNGAILGMGMEEIKRKFDAIVDFSGVEQFIDTPVKRYSSGMYVRLAFAVAAHLDAEILVVDEVLAVGDAEFQRKCMGRMDGVAKEGRTVLLVSHNMPVIQRLCKTAYLLDNGCIASYGEAAAVVDTYYKSAAYEEGVTLTELPPGQAKFFGWRVTSALKEAGPSSCYTGDPCTFEFDLVLRRPVTRAIFGMALWGDDGTLVWAMRSIDHGNPTIGLEPGVYHIRFRLDRLPVRPGLYQIEVSGLTTNEVLERWYAQPKLQIFPRNESGMAPQWQGILNLDGEFDFSFIKEVDSQPTPAERSTG